MSSRGVKHPMLWVAVAFASGIVTARWLPVPLAPGLAGGLILALVALGAPAIRAWLIWPLLFVAGSLALSWQTAPLHPGDLRRQLGTQPLLAQVRGQVADSPSLRVAERAGRERLHTLAQVDVSAWRTNGGWQPAFGRVLVTTPGGIPPGFHAGTRVELQGVISPPPVASGPGLFDYREHLQWMGIHYQLRLRSTNDWQCLKGATQPDVPLCERFLDWAQATISRGLPQTDQALELLWAMTLGWKTGLRNEVVEPFMLTGTMHVFAISGLHIALLAAILLACLRAVRVPRLLCGLVVIPGLWFYTGATGWQSSAIRSALMTTVVVAGWSLRRPSNLLNSLMAAAFAILVWDPRQLFQPGFQLSFFVVLSLALLLPPVSRLVLKPLEPDPLLPASLIPTWKRRAQVPLRWLLASVATSLAAWVGSLPIIAWYFHLLTPVSLLANVVVVPLSSLALMCNLGSLLCGSWLAPCAVLFNHSAWFFMRCMMVFSEGCARLPLASFNLPAPHPAQILAWYLLVLAAVTGWIWRTDRRRYALPAAIVLCLVCVIPYLWPERDTRLFILPSQGSSAILVRQPGGTLLVDAGRAESYAFLVKPFLRAQGVNRLAAVAASHGDIRHVGGVLPASREFTTREVVTSRARSRSPVYRQLLAELERDPARWRQVGDGDQVAGWRVLHPGVRPLGGSADDHPLVLFRACGAPRVLLLSDLTQRGQNELLATHPNLRAEVVIAGLPSQGEALSPSLLEYLQPKLIVVQDDGHPSGNRAPLRLRQRLSQLGLPVYYTSDTAVLEIRFTATGPVALPTIPPTPDAEAVGTDREEDGPSSPD